MPKKPKKPSSPPNLVDGSTIKPQPLPNDEDFDAMRQELEWQEKVNDIRELGRDTDRYLLDDEEGGEDDDGD